jgi:hypothetical protein
MVGMTGLAFFVILRNRIWPEVAGPMTDESGQ